jgi:hypothetical protein
VDRTDLQGEGDLKELGQQAIEARERRANLVFPEKRRGQLGFRDNVREFAQAHSDMDAGRMEDLSPLPSGPMWLDEETFAGKLPLRWQVLLRLLAAPRELLELLGKRIREISLNTRTANEGIDIRANQLCNHLYFHLCFHRLSSVYVAGSALERGGAPRYSSTPVSSPVK